MSVIVFSSDITKLCISPKIKAKWPFPKMILLTVVSVSAITFLISLFDCLIDLLLNVQ